MPATLEDWRDACLPCLPALSHLHLCYLHLPPPLLPAPAICPLPPTCLPAFYLPPAGISAYLPLLYLTWKCLPLHCEASACYCLDSA